MTPEQIRELNVYDFRLAFYDTFKFYPYIIVETEGSEWLETLDNWNEIIPLTFENELHMRFNKEEILFTHQKQKGFVTAKMKTHYAQYAKYY